MSTNREDYPVEEVPTPKMKTIKRRQLKKVVQNDEDKLCIAWTPEEEISLCKAWIRISEDIFDDCPKWKGVELLNIEEHRREKYNRYKCFGNSSSFKMSQSRAASFNLNTRARDDKDEEEDVQEVQQPMGRDIAKKKGVTSTKSSASSNEDALARLMVNEYVDLTQTYKERKSKNVEAFIEIKKREMDLRAQEIKMQEME
nr:hypothetical protein [Tanacetum cinerariifolium]